MEEEKEKMNRMRKMAGLFFPILIIFVFFALRFWAQEECVEHNLGFTETFSCSFPNPCGGPDQPPCVCPYQDPISSVAHWGEGYITLNKTGEEFLIRNPSYIPIWINTVTANDFDNDGWPDFIGSSSSYSNVLAFVRNMGKDGNIGTFTITQWIDGCQGSGGTPTKGVNGAAIDTSGHCGLTSGDYDGDGDIDFLFVVSSDVAPYNIKRIWLYRNNLKESGTLSFAQIDKTSAWSATLKGIAWSATMMVTIDFDKDNDPDIILGNKAGEVIKINNRNKTRALDASNKWNFSTILTQSSIGWSGRGVSTVSIADFDADGDLDMILGSVSYPELQYWKNDGSGVFSRYTTYTDPTKNTHNNYYDGAATVSVAYDYNKDNGVDLIIGTDDWNYDTDTAKDAYGGSGLGGQCYYFKNDGKGGFIQKLIFDGQVATPVVWDFDLGANLDFNQDPNGLMDFLIADGNHSERYYLFINTMADVYNLQGIAQSTNITPTLDPNLYAITRVRVKNLNQSVIGGPSAGLEVTYYVSNNDGKDWEFYARFAGTEIKEYAELPWHTFENYGSKLKWKAELTATDDNIPDYPNSSYETPKVDNIEFDIIHVDRREYSRTSVAATIVDDSGQRIELIIGGTFYYPGWQGHLIAYDVSGMAPVNSTYSELRTVSRSDLSSPTGREIVAPGVTIRWDAGSLLSARSPASRVIYTAIPNPEGTALNRTDFTVTNVDTLGGYLQDVQGDNAGLIDFVRGEDRDWKLGDINHSNPVVVGPPNEVSSLMGDGYEAFKAAFKDRRKVLYVGANDGMFHCFDVLRGEELWAFIPYNLLPKLKNMWAVDEATMDRYFARDVYVDGSPAVADVYLDGTWRTILVCGQGPGKGSVVAGGSNYYFALDVTDPANPMPLWELTHQTMGETWSVPAVAKVTKNGQATWVGFVGSGYDNNPDPGAILGNIFYAIDLEEGSIFWTYAANEVDTTAKFANIQNTMPGSPDVVDVNRDGFADRVYIGDLDGRMWRMDVSAGFEDANSWRAESIYTDPDNYPITTKPAVWKNPNNLTADPRIYFGTGGDDKAPSDATYSFVALIDRGTSAGIEWYLGNPSGEIRPEAKDVGNLGIGEKVWADPKIEDYIVYFSTLTGSIESVDPCVNLTGLGKLYARFVISVSGTPVGGTAFKSAAGTLESLNLAIKTRSAVTIGEQEITETGVRKRDVYIQEYNSTVQRLEQLTGGILKIKSWREVYKVFKQ
jgi:hypothetical protein